MQIMGKYSRHADNMEIYCISGTPRLICSAIIYSNRLNVFALKDHLRDSSLSNLSLFLGVNFLKFVPRVLLQSIKKHRGCGMVHVQIQLKQNVACRFAHL